MLELSNLLVFAALVFLLVFGAGVLPFLSQLWTRPAFLYRMTCLAAGFLIAAALLIAIPEGFELYLSGSEHSGHDQGHGSTLTAGLAVLLGFLFMMVLEGLGFGHDLHEEHHDHVEDHGHDHVNHPSGQSTSVVIGLTLHAIMDGVVIAAAFSAGGMLLSVQLAIVVLMHKFPAAFSLSAYSLHERRNPKRSLIDLTLFASATPIAMLISGYWFEQGLDEWQPLAVLFAAGSFIYVSTVDVLPNIHIRSKSKETLVLVLLGIVLMALLSFLVAAIFPDIAAH